ncbi:hypothetical protein [Bradyrhizobium sp. LTSPM299]|uniref:hypothetical protein n=1 Tax=Bradyrhizobium sp. LTSPM299 TaxID=1619233 RepID=UPI0012E1AA9C|nr:hypothetical protein [Bradyrhizobium sp. LTSPM299]
MRRLKTRAFSASTINHPCGCTGCVVSSADHPSVGFYEIILDFARFTKAADQLPVLISSRTDALAVDDRDGRRRCPDRASQPSPDRTHRWNAWASCSHATYQQLSCTVRQLLPIEIFAGINSRLLPVSICNVAIAPRITNMTIAKLIVTHVSQRAAAFRRAGDASRQRAMDDS